MRVCVAPTFIMVGAVVIGCGLPLGSRRVASRTTSSVESASPFSVMRQTLPRASLPYTRSAVLSWM
jgi:hypothetical protein